MASTDDNFRTQVLCAFVAYQFAKFACKVKIQNSSFSVPLTLVMPALIGIVTLMCHKRTNPEKECTYKSLGLEYAFFRFVSYASYQLES